MAARLKRYVNSRALGGETLAFKIPKRHDFGMRSTHMLRGTPGKHLTLARDHAAHARIRRRHVQRTLRQRNRLAHEELILIGMVTDHSRHDLLAHDLVLRIGGPCISRMASTNSPISSKLL